MDTELFIGDDEFMRMLDDYGKPAPAKAAIVPTLSRNMTKKSKSKHDDDEYVDDDDSSGEQAKKKRVVDVAVAGAGKFIVEVADAEVPSKALERLVTLTPMMQVVANVSNPANYNTYRKIIVDMYDGAICTPVHGPVDGGNYFVSLDIMWELSRYFQGVMGGSRKQLEGALSRIGTRFSDRVIPGPFAVGYTGNATTFVIDGTILKYLWKRYKTFTQAELLVVPERISYKGNVSCLNFGKCYVMDRQFPDSKERDVIEAMVKEDFVRDMYTGFVRFGVSSDFWKIIGREAKDKLLPEREAAAFINDTIAGEELAKKSAYVHRYTYTSPIISAKQVPRTVERLRVCLVFSNDGKLLLFPSFRDHEHGFVKFDKERPKTDYPFTTLKL